MYRGRRREKMPVATSAKSAGIKVTLKNGGEEIFANKRFLLLEKDGHWVTKPDLKFDDPDLEKYIDYQYWRPLSIYFQAFVDVEPSLEGHIGGTPTMYLTRFFTFLCIGINQVNLEMMENGKDCICRNNTPSLAMENGLLSGLTNKNRSFSSGNVTDQAAQDYATRFESRELQMTVQSAHYFDWHYANTYKK